MSFMDMEFPGDARDARVRARQNISDSERWGSIAGGAGLALYGLTRRTGSGWLMAAVGALLVRRGMSGYSSTYQMLGINTAGTANDTRQALSGPRGVVVEESVVINRSADELFRFWRNLENLPRFMQHLESVERVTDTLSRWKAKGPGVDLEWNAEIINEVPSKVIGWRSLEHSDVVSAGSVNFEEIAPGRTTRVRVRLQYAPPGGQVGAALARLLGRDAATEIREDLHQLKQMIETGQISASES
jgi:uncharacterized membrane protein